MLVLPTRAVARKRSCATSPDLGQEYSIGFGVSNAVKAAIEALPDHAWRTAIDSDGESRDGAQVAEMTASMPVTSRRGTAEDWPPGMRVIVRREKAPTSERSCR